MIVARFRQRSDALCHAFKDKQVCGHHGEPVEQAVKACRVP